MHSRLARPQYQVYLPVLYSVFSLKKVKRKKQKEKRGNGFMSRLGTHQANWLMFDLLPALWCWWSSNCHSNNMFHVLWSSQSWAFLCTSVSPLDGVTTQSVELQPTADADFDQTWDCYQKAWPHLALLLAGLLCEYSITTAVTMLTKNFKIDICDPRQQC